MKVINLNSRFELTQTQINYAELVVICGDITPMRDDSIFALMNEIPVFLIDREIQNEHGNGDPLGFYQPSSKILTIETPIIGLCLEKIVDVAKTDEELIILIAKVLIHEFAHAMMNLDQSAVYNPIDEFYEWMEEPMANAITLSYFNNFDRCFRYRGRNRDIQFAYVKTIINPFDFVKNFISKQQDNYRLGIDLFEHRIDQWWIWRKQKTEIQKKTKEKKDWLDYVKLNVGKTDEDTLEKLFKELYK